MESLSLWLGVTAALIAMLASLTTRALRVFSRHQLARRCQRHRRPDRLASILNHRRHCRIAAEILQVVATVGVVWAALDWSPDLPLGLTAAVLVLMAAEVWMSRAIAHVWTEGFLFHAWPVIYLWGRVLRPLVAVGTGLDHLMHRLTGRPFHLGLGAAVEQEIHTVVNEAEREGHLEPDAREMIERAIEMRQAEVSKIMTPRTDMVTIPVTATLEEARHFMIESAHSRVPVYRESRDDIVGILYVRDLLAQWGQETEPRALLERVMRKPFFVPETKRVPALLQEFQRHHVQIAIVLDEYGGVSGLVTIEDILEEIVGEIVDEYDEAPRETIQPVSEHVVEVDARVHIDELNERLGLSLPEDGDFDTLGGFVFSHLGRLPALGEHFEYAHVRFTMIAVGKRSIDRIQLELEQQAELRRSDRAAQ